jgi:hypothetical protein
VSSSLHQEVLDLDIVVRAAEAEPAAASTALRVW